jgi:hypothetical protein
LGLGTGIRGKAHECSVSQKGGGKAEDCTSIGVPVESHKVVYTEL